MRDRISAERTILMIILNISLALYSPSALLIRSV